MERGATSTVEDTEQGPSGVRVTMDVARRLLDGDAGLVLDVAEQLGEPGRHAVDAVRRPLGRSALRLGLPAVAWTIPVRWSPTSALVLVPVPGAAGVLDVVAVPAASLPGVVAGLVELRPGPTDPCRSPLVLPAELVDGWLRGAPQSVLDAAIDDPGVRAALVAVRGGLRSSWSVTSELPSDGGQLVSRALRVLDAGAAGLWAVHRLPDRGGVAILDPTTAGALWDLLCGVLATRPIREATA